MHIITKKRITEAKTKYPHCASALAGWFRVIEKNNFNDFSNLKKTFNSVDKAGDKYIFDIGGNKLRLIASIHFNRNKLYIREILSHTEYDEGKWRKKNVSPAIKRKAGRKKS